MLCADWIFHDLMFLYLDGVWLEFSLVCLLELLNLNTFGFIGIKEIYLFGLCENSNYLLF